MTDQKPTGVFVRLPLSGAEKMALTSGVKMGGDIEAGIAAIGSPVMGGELEISGYIPEKPCLTKRDGTNASTFEDREDRRHTIPLVRQSDAQAQIAMRDAEIVRLREALESLENANNNLCFMRSNDTYQSMMRDGCGDLLAKLDDARRAAREALKGGAA